ncbi:hypothetical protein [Methanocella arvoryzae]|uniref:hypothetical protein n=1 Tax=Methanocella arvoryzae TaxID=1175445 RepID=UPI0013051ECC|nr:hypothetical protein [Methanocella arvoryzae]
MADPDVAALPTAIAAPAKTDSASSANTILNVLISITLLNDRYCIRASDAIDHETFKT